MDSYAALSRSWQAVSVRVLILTLAVATAAALAAGAGGTPTPRLEAPTPADLAYSGPIRDSAVSTRTVQASAFWGGTYTASTGEPVMIFASTAYPVDDAVAQRWAEFAASLVHGAELTRVRIYLVPPREIRGTCGFSALACYDAADAALVDGESRLPAHRERRPVAGQRDGLLQAEPRRGICRGVSCPQRAEARPHGDAVGHRRPAPVPRRSRARRARAGRPEPVGRRADPPLHRLRRVAHVHRRDTARRNGARDAAREGHRCNLAFDGHPARRWRGDGVRDRLRGPHRPRPRHASGLGREDGVRADGHAPVAVAAPRILVVDDERALRDSLRRALALEGYEVELATDGQDALRRLAADAVAPDAILLDVLMPGLDGIEVARRLRAGGDRTPILMLTARAEVEDRVAGLDAGADDYVVKPFALDELFARVRALLRRADREESEVLRFADLELEPATRDVRRGGERIELTRTEFALLELFLRNPRQVLTRSLIFERVWGYDFGLSSNSLDVYIGYLRRKTEAGGRPRLIYTVRGVGYALREP